MKYLNHKIEKQSNDSFKMQSSLKEDSYVHLFLNENLLPNEECLNRLDEISASSKLLGPVIALPDLYLKEKNYIPTGISLVTEEISNQLLTPPNDGFLQGELDLAEQDISREVIEKTFQILMEKVSVFRREEPLCSSETLWEILQKGISSIYEEWGFSKDDLRKFDHQGNVFCQKEVSKKEIKDSFPNSKPDFLPEFVPWFDVETAGRHCLGVLDGGSHFIECNVIDQIIDENAARSLGLKKNRVMVSIHNGPADVGLISHNANLDRSINQISYFKKDSKEEKSFLTAYNASANFAYANRLYILAQIRDSFSEVLGTQIKCKVVSDAPHDMLEEINLEDKKAFLHRKGCTRALPGCHFDDNHPFAKTGKPFYFPAAVGEDSYIMSNKIGNKESYFTTSHGTGRQMKLEEAINKFDKDDVIKGLEKKDILLFRYGRTNFATQSPNTYKKMDEVFNLLKSFKLAEPIVRLSPIATLKA